MIFHTPDTSCKTLASAWKRAEHFAPLELVVSELGLKSYKKPAMASSIIDKKHPLAAAWENCKMFLDAEGVTELDRLPQETDKEYLKRLRDEQSKEAAYSIVCLDWFATKLDNYAKSNILKDDKTVQTILYEWRERMIFNPTLI